MPGCGKIPAGACLWLQAGPISRAQTGCAQIVRTDTTSNVLRREVVMPVANELSRPVIPAARRLFHVTLAVPMFIMALSVPPAGAAEPPLLSAEEFLAEVPAVLPASRIAQPQGEAAGAGAVIR